MQTAGGRRSPERKYVGPNPFCTRFWIPPVAKRDETPNASLSPTSRSNRSDLAQLYAARAPVGVEHIMPVDCTPRHDYHRPRDKLRHARHGLRRLVRPRARRRDVVDVTPILLAARDDRQAARDLPRLERCGGSWWFSSRGVVMAPPFAVSPRDERGATGRVQVDQRETGTREVAPERW